MEEGKNPFLIIIQWLKNHLLTGMGMVSLTVWTPVQMFLIFVNTMDVLIQMETEFLIMLINALQFRALRVTRDVLFLIQMGMGSMMKKINALPYRDMHVT